MARTAPAPDDALRARLDAVAERLLHLARDLHAHPETAFAEHHAADALTALLADAGLTVERGTAGLPTAFTATAGPSGADLTVGLCLEYDALPDLGHACGHNLIAAAGAGAAIALAAVADDLGLRVKALGTPAEESGGGKVHLLRAGAFDDVSFAMMVHPGPADDFGGTSRASRGVQAEYRGRAAHAAIAPYDGVNAADACVIAQTALALLRQQLPDGVRMHGIVTHGGDRTNVIPALARVSWQLRADTLDELEALWPRVRACFEAGAVATGCELTLTEPAAAYADLRQDAWLGDTYARHVRALGRTPEPAASIGASTDMGNVSHALPAIHPTIGLGCAARPHTAEFAAAAVGEQADRAVLDAALALARTAADLATDPAQRTRITDAHRARSYRPSSAGSPLG
ncbi:MULTISPECIES: amidohydrolase [Streptomyces]|uniref:amidohydrolase n=1 Tax=Streptomyces TaxID=1883 RepID=UPI0009971EBC|nr:MULTISPECIES: amidohydrolase [Streptomyces]